MKVAIKKVRVPGKSLAARSFAHVDYADAFAARLPGNWHEDVDALTLSVLTTGPRWVAWLLRLRDLLVRPLGLETAGVSTVQTVSSIQPGGKVGMFPVLARTSDEIMVGKNDRHLDFRASVLVKGKDGAKWVVVSTVVHFNNGLGRVYFLPVSFFHRLIIRSLLSRAIAAL